MPALPRWRLTDAALEGMVEQEAGSRKGEDGVEILLGHIFSGI